MEYNYAINVGLNTALNAILIINNKVDLVLI